MKFLSKVSGWLKSSVFAFVFITLSAVSAYATDPEQLIAVDPATPGLAGVTVHPGVIVAPLAIIMITVITACLAIKFLPHIVNFCLRWMKG